jgi:hypothetical protein
VIVLLVIALAVTVTILVTRDGSNGNSPMPPGDGQASEFASANDTGPVNIITEDPTCDAWGKITREYTDEIQKAGWLDRDPQVSADVWTPAQRATYEESATAMSRSADQAEKLVELTPHRVVREIYAQYSIYTRAFVERIPGYTAEDDNLAATSDALANSVTNICGAIDYRSAAPIVPLIDVPPAPTSIAPIEEADGSAFLSESNLVCAEWEATALAFSDETSAWRSIDPKISAAEWTPEQRAINNSAAATMRANADTVERLGRDSGNPILEDLAVLGAQYRRAYASALPTYTEADNFLSEAASNAVKAVNFGCKDSA